MQHENQTINLRHYFKFNRKLRDQTTNLRHQVNIIILLRSYQTTKKKS